MKRLDLVYDKIIAYYPHLKNLDISKRNARKTFVDNLFNLTAVPALTIEDYYVISSEEFGFERVRYKK